MLLLLAEDQYFLQTHMDHKYTHIIQSLLRILQKKEVWLFLISSLWFLFKIAIYSKTQLKLEVLLM